MSNQTSGPPTSPSAQPAASAAEYRVERFVGGYDRLVLLKEASDHCASITLRNGPAGGALPYPITVPKDWNLEGISVNPKGCARSQGAPGIKHAEGFVRLSVGANEPSCTWDVDIRIEREPSGDSPATVLVRAAAVSVPCQ